MEAAEVNATLLFTDSIKDLLDAARFLASEAAAADRVLDLPGGRVRGLLPGRELGLEPGECPAGVHVGGVLGQDRAHDLVEDRHRAPGFDLTLLRAQPALYFPDDRVIRYRDQPPVLSPTAAQLVLRRSGKVTVGPRVAECLRRLIAAVRGLPAVDHDRGLTRMPQARDHDPAA